VPLGPELCVVDIGHPYGRVLELGTRLGAQSSSAPGSRPTTPPSTSPGWPNWPRATTCALLSPATGTAVATLEQAAAAVEAPPAASS
jgi:hypothetical protein